jgi:hypothetical protein
LFDIRLLIKNFNEFHLDLRGVFSPPLMIADHTAAELSVTGNDRSIEYYFASDARYKIKNLERKNIILFIVRLLNILIK